jgi:hypothetical protein
MPDPSLLQRLKERKLVQWAVAYLAGAMVPVKTSVGTKQQVSVWRFVIVVLGLSVLVGCQPTSQLPDFTGTWTFDASRSVMQIPAPDSSVFTIEHLEPRFLLSRIHYYGEQSDTFSIDLTTDGVETQRSYPYFLLNGSAYWDGEILVFDSELVIDGESGTNVVRYSLEDDGRTFIADEHFVMGGVILESCGTALKWVRG